MPTATKNTLSPADLAWLRVQTPENLSVTTVVLVCREPVDEACLKSRIEDQLLAEPRFRQRVEFPHLSWIRPHWVEHDDFQLDDHLVRLDASESSRFDSLLSELRSRPFDRALPLWQLHLTHLADGRSAIVFRLHAAIADPNAALDLALRLTDDESDPQREPSELSFEHSIPLHRILERSEKHASSTRALCRLISSRSDRDSPLRHRPTVTKSLAWSAPIELRHLEKRAAGLETSMINVLMAGVIGALRTAVHGKDVPTEDVRLRAVVPLSLRQVDSSPVGTQLALGLLRLPLDGATPAERVAHASEAMERLGLATGQMAVLGPGATQGLSMTDFEERSLRLLGKKATVMLGIADGPPEATTVCGQPLTELLWWPAEFGEISLGISVATYAGSARFVICCDNSLDLDPQEIADNMAAACESL